MKTLKHSLRKIVSFLNNEEEEGGFWLPNIQRPFVWDEEQMCRLFDSILRQYPISTLLVWKTKSAIRRRKFIDNYRPQMRLSHLYVPEDKKKKCLVLDGQQRLQSLFIGLKGSYEGRELAFNLLSGEVSAPDDIRYKFEFRDPDDIKLPWIRFKNLVFSNDDYMTATDKILDKFDQELSSDDRKKVGRHVSIVFKAFQGDDGISYQELDSTENADLYTEDDVVEIFIRANSGGTRLGKSDLLFSLLSSSWERSDERMEELLLELNRSGFDFSRDFILKTCLTVLDQGARYEVAKFRDVSVRDRIESEWAEISKSIRAVVDFVQGKTFIRCDKALPSYLVLIPLIYARHHFSKEWDDAKDRDGFLLRCLMAGAFSGTPDQLIDDSVKKLKELKRFNATELFGVVRSKGRSLEITQDRLWNMGYGSKNIHLLFNLWYRDFNYTPSYENNMPQVDHIFPQSLLKTVKDPNPETRKMNIMRYRKGARDQLANCMLLTARENGAGGKSDTPPSEWFKDKPKEYLEKHLIPQDKELWKLDRFEDFLAARKNLITEKFSFLLATSSASAVDLGAMPVT